MQNAIGIPTIINMKNTTTIYIGWDWFSFQIIRQFVRSSNNRYSYSLNSLKKV